jgi:mannan endo-1,4-beta-mannosidase
MVGSEGPSNEPWRVHPALQNEAGDWNEALFKGLDFLLAEMEKREMSAVLVLTNFFQWSGGMAQYVSWATKEPIPYPHDTAHTWDDFQKFSATFYENKKAQKLFKRFIRKIVKRKNSITKIRYKNDPTIMAWQLANEPRGFGQGQNYIDWVDETAQYIHKKDKNHLVSLGGEGKTPSGHAGTLFEEVSQSKYLDYLTAHLWVENWGWYQPDSSATYKDAVDLAKAYIEDHVNIAESLSKPIVFEEFGISRDGRNYDPSSSIAIRDQYYEMFFQTIHQHAKQSTSLMGCNFWSWAGEGYPNKAGAFWQKGDVLTGDPPHELQGWYSIYEKDHSTLALIKKYNDALRTLGEEEKVSSTNQ